MAGKRKRGAKAAAGKPENKTEIQVKTVDEPEPKIEPAAKKIKKENSGKNKKLRYFDKSKPKFGKCERGVVYVNSLPHGFYEKQLEGYFGQFGKVTGVYVPKSKQTGKCKGYGFVEFLHPEVATIAAETMNNYLMFNRIIKTKVIPPEKQRPGMFKEKYKLMKCRRHPDKVAQKLGRRSKLLRDRGGSLVKKAVNSVARIQESMKTRGIKYKFKVIGLDEDVKLTGVKPIDPERDPQASVSPQLRTRRLNRNSKPGLSAGQDQ